MYVALCYYKLDYYDVSQEVLAVYLQHYPDSAIAINLKACNHFRLYNGKAAEQVTGLSLMTSHIDVGLRSLYNLKLQSKSNLDQVQRKVIDKNVT